MDEPFSALDVLTAESLRGELMELWLKKQIPTKSIFLVTHNIEEAVLLADRVIVLDRNPARIHADFQIPMQQPRDRKSAEFLVYVDYIYKVMTQPELELAPPARRELPAKSPFQRLPQAKPGGMAGLLEFLNDRGGEEDMYHLADELLMEVDDLFPLVEEAVLLGFAKSHEGDVEITAAGKAFAEADIATRKRLFREAALANVVLLHRFAALWRKSRTEPYPWNSSETSSTSTCRKRKWKDRSRPSWVGAGTPRFLPTIRKPIACYCARPQAPRIPTPLRCTDRGLLDIG